MLKPKKEVWRGGDKWLFSQDSKTCRQQEQPGIFFGFSHPEATLFRLSSGIPSAQRCLKDDVFTYPVK